MDLLLATRYNRLPGADDGLTLADCPWSQFSPFSVAVTFTPSNAITYVEHTREIEKHPKQFHVDIHIIQKDTNNLIPGEVGWSTNQHQIYLGF